MKENFFFHLVAMLDLKGILSARVTSVTAFVLKVLLSLMLLHMKLIPLITMGSGIIFLFVSIILLAAQRLPVTLWSTCLTVLWINISITTMAVSLYIGA